MMSDEVDVVCKLCNESFKVSKIVLESRLIETCQNCFRKSTIKLNQEDINIRKLKHLHQDLLFRPDHVIDNLYLGGYRCAEKLSVLEDLNIRSVVVCGTDLETFFPSDINYLKFELEDNYDQHIKDCFEKAHEFILNASTSNSNVLIHCHAGVSRSATVVISYLMKHYNMTVLDARSYLKKKRPCICPNSGFIAQLEEYEISLQATT